MVSCDISGILLKNISRDRLACDAAPSIASRLIPLLTPLRAAAAITPALTPHRRLAGFRSRATGGEDIIATPTLDSALNTEVPQNVAQNAPVHRRFSFSAHIRDRAAPPRMRKCHVGANDGSLARAEVPFYYHCGKFSYLIDGTCATVDTRFCIKSLCTMCRWLCCSTLIKNITGQASWVEVRRHWDMQRHRLAYPASPKVEPTCCCHAVL